MPPIDEEKYRAALKKLDAVLAEDDGTDNSGIDNLPEIDELPDSPDRTQAVVIPKA